MPAMRAKMRVTSVVKNSETQETLNFSAVAKSSNYPEDGADEDNSYAKFTPTASISLSIANPALLGKFAENDVYYVDFTKAG